MRNKYSKEFEDEMRQLAPCTNLDRLLWYAYSQFGYEINRSQLRQYLSKRKIRYKDYNKNKVRMMGLNRPIGSERIRDDGMVQVKVSKDKWEYKQRLIYEKYHNVKLTDNDYIIFLDQDRTNFDINNLEKVTRYESSVLTNQKLFSKKSDLTKVGINVAQLIIKLKDKRKEND